jgi:predicted transcriptional regulator YheO
MHYFSQIPHFGFCREGEGRVVYVLSRMLEIEELNVIKAIADKSLGKEQWSEYDPSIVETANYLIEDEQNIYGLLSINESSDLLHTFFMELLEKNIKVISINFESSAVKTINQIDDSFIKSIDKNSYVFAREYDHINSY